MAWVEAIYRFPSPCKVLFFAKEVRESNLAAMHTLCHSVLTCPSRQRAASQTANQCLLAQHNTDHRAYNLESLQYYLRGPQSLYSFSIKHSPEKQCFAAKGSHVFRQHNQAVSIYSFKTLHFKETISLHILVSWSLCALPSYLWLPCSHLPKQSEWQTWGWDTGMEVTVFVSTCEIWHISAVAGISHGKKMNSYNSMEERKEKP